MGLFNRMLVPRSVELAMHPVRRAVSSRPVRRATYQLWTTAHPIRAAESRKNVWWCLPAPERHTPLGGPAPGTGASVASRSCRPLPAATLSGRAGSCPQQPPAGR